METKGSPAFPNAKKQKVYISISLINLMNFFKRLFKKKIKNPQLNPLLSSLGMSKDAINRLYSHEREGHTHNAYGKLDVQQICNAETQHNQI